MADELAYVCGNAAGGIMVIDTVLGTQTTTFRPGITYNFICITPDGTQLYATRSAANQIDVIDSTLGTLVTSYITTGPSVPTGICITPDGSHVYVVNDGNPSFLYDIDTTLATITLALPLPVGGTGAGYGSSSFPSVSPDGTKLAIQYNGAVAGGGHVEVYSVPALGLLGTILTSPFTAADNPIAWLGNTIGYSSDGSHLRGFALDMVGFTLIADFPKTGTSNEDTVNITGLFVYDASTTVLSKWSTASNTEIATFSLGTVIENSRITPDGSTVVISDLSVPAVYLWDTATDTLRATVTTTGVGEGLCLFPAITSAVSIGNLFIPRKGFGSSGTGYQASDFITNWLAIENWANHAWSPAVPNLFIPNKPVGRPPTPGEIDQNWLTIERWAGAIGTI